MKTILTTLICSIFVAFFCCNICSNLNTKLVLCNYKVNTIYCIINYKLPVTLLSNFDRDMIS